MNITTYAKHLSLASPLEASANLLKNCFGLAKLYIIPKTQLQKTFSGAVIILDLIIFAAFLAFAITRKLEMETNLFYDMQFSTDDGGWMEVMGYYLELFCAAMFASLAKVNKQPQWYAWSIIFFVTFIDDCFGAHEFMGNYLIDSYTRAEGELIGFLVIGCLFAVVWLLGLATGPKQGKLFYTYILFSIIFAALTFCGMGIDFIHTPLHDNWHVPDTLLNLAEDGMELIIISISAMAVLGFWIDQKKTAYPAETIAS